MLCNTTGKPAASSGRLTHTQLRATAARLWPHRDDCRVLSELVPLLSQLQAEAEPSQRQQTPGGAFSNDAAFYDRPTVNKRRARLEIRGVADRGGCRVGEVRDGQNAAHA